LRPVNRNAPSNIPALCPSLSYLSRLSSGILLPNPIVNLF
jgi:hypothetical protein